MHQHTPDPIEEIGLDDSEFRAMLGVSDNEPMDNVVRLAVSNNLSRASRLLAAGQALRRAGE